MGPSWELRLWAGRFFAEGPLSVPPIASSIWRRIEGQHLRYGRSNDRPRLFWNWRFEKPGTGVDWLVIIPLWMPFLLVLIPTTYLWYRDWRAIPPGHCQTCGYDLTANTSGRCPECGQPLNSTTNEAKA